MSLRNIIASIALSATLLGVSIFAPAVYGQQSKIAGPLEWDKLIDASRKEGKVTVSIPASQELKTQIEEQFKKRFGVEVEVFTARGSAGVRRIADEFKAGVRKGMRAPIMIQIASALTEEETKAAAEYFASLKPP